MSQFYKLSVQDIQKETPNAVCVTFAIPNHLKEIFSFKAGQYITLKATIQGEEIRRDYSLCSAPNSGIIQVAIKVVEGGVFSKFANTILQVGDELEVAKPNGRFTFKPNDNKTKNIALFAAGSGITPILSIIKCALTEEVNSKVILVYGNKTTKNTMFLNTLLNLQHQYHDRFAIQFVFSQEDSEDALFGRIEKSTVNYITKNKYKHIAVDAFYLCGPEGMIHTVKNVLTEQNIPENTIYYELFKAAKNTTSNSTATNSGEAKVTILLDDESTTFTMQKKQTILEVAIDKDLDAPYSCQGGICSSCIARVTAGEVSMRQNNILNESELAEGLILTCQAQPVSDSVTINYDEV